MADKRLAKGIDGVERPWSLRERYMLYSRGFRDGAATRAMREECKGLEAYDRGYADGRKACNVACRVYAEEIGYEPTILRAE